MKLPFKEQVLRWVDIFTYFHYPDFIREKAYEIVHQNIKTRSIRPALVALASIYISCDIYNISFNEQNKLLAELIYNGQMYELSHGRVKRKKQRYEFKMRNIRKKAHEILENTEITWTQNIK